MKKNDRGFTLIELIVSIAILGIIAVAAGGFLVTGTRTYANVNYSVRLQYESQLAMSQIQNYVMNCNSGIAYDDSSKTLYVADSETDSHPLYLFKYDDAAHQLKFSSGSASQNISIAGGSADKIMAEHVTAFSVACVPDGSGRADSIKITLKLAMGGKDYEGSETIALRNRPYYSDSWSGLWENIK